MSAEGGTKAILAALVANLGIAIAKFVAFLFTGAASMLAESVHSVADSSNQALLLLGGRRAKRAPTALHPFGFGRERYFWSFVVALVLFSMGAMFSLYEGYQKLRHPHAIDAPQVAIGVLIVAIGLESISMWTAIKESRPYKGNSTWWGFIRRSRHPELPVVLLEDAGALFGLIFALVAVCLSAATHNEVYDALGTLAIGVLLLAIAIVLMIEMKGLLIGEAADDEQRGAIESAITTHASVRSLLGMRTQHIGPDELLVGAKVELVPGLDVGGVAAAIDGVESAIRAAVPSCRIVYIEPGIERSATATTTA